MNRLYRCTQITTSVLLLLTLLSSCAHQRSAPRPLATDIKVGSYYFPGHFHAGRWSPMVASGGPTPLLGYYRDGAPGVSDWHIRWAVEHGISFFVFDWYCSYKNGPNTQHNTGLDKGFLKAEHRNLMEFALMWCNEERGKQPLYTVEDMLRTAGHMGKYFREDNYLRIDGRPLVVVSRASRMAESFGRDFRALIPRMSRAAGLPPGTDIFFVALASDPDPMLRDMGFEATTAYNYHNARAKKHGSPLRATYDDMIESYEQIWRRMTAPGALPYIVPLSPGWDSRTWYGTQAFVRTGSTPEKFRDMCRRSQRYANPKLNMVLAECWNEFGEGSYLEPCEKTGFGYLRAMRDVFAAGEKTKCDRIVPSKAEKTAFTFPTIPLQSSPGTLGKQKGNLVFDPDMEEGNGWITYSGTPSQFSTDNVRSGQRSLLIPPGEGCKALTPVPMGRGRTYRISAWVKCAPGGNLEIRLTWFDKQNRWTRKSTPVATCRDTDWTQITKEIIVVEPQAAGAKLEFVGRNAKVWVDDVSVVNTREAEPAATALDADCTSGKDWVTFAGKTPTGESSPDGGRHIILRDRQGMKTRRTVAVKPGDTLVLRVRLKCNPLASLSISLAGLDADGEWIKGTYFGMETYSWQDWIELSKVIHIPENTPAKRINIDCYATGGAVRISQAKLEWDNLPRPSKKGKQK